MPRLGAHRPIHPVAGTLRETAQGHFIRFAAARVRPDLARYAGRLLPGSSHGRSVDVDDRRTVTSTDYDEPALFVARVALSMNGPLRHVQEVAGAGLDHSASPRSQLHPQGAVDHINGWRDPEVGEADRLPDDPPERG